MKRLLFLLVLLPFFSFGQIISQYVETATGSQPKLIEIYNNTGSAIDFSSTPLKVKYQANGGSESNKETINDGTLAAGEVLVLGPSEATAAGVKTQVLANNPNVRYIEETWYFNGNDQIRLELDGTTTDTFGRASGNSYSSWGGVQAKDSNISRKVGIFSGDTDYWAVSQSSDDNISIWWETTVDFPSGYPSTSDYAAALAGVGIPPDQYIHNGTNWLSWDSTNDITVTTPPSGTSTKPVYISSGTVNLSSSISFPSVEIAAGSVLSVAAGNDLTISSSSNSSSYNSGKLINNGGTLTLESSSSAFSTLSIDGSLTGNMTYSRWINDVSDASPSASDQGWDLVGSPVTGSSVSTSGLATNGSNVAMMEYDNTDNTWTNTSSASISTTNGKGYAMATPADNPATVAFTGTLTSGNESIVISNNNGSGSGTQWNLVSNPYPQFLAINSNAQNESSASSNFLWYNGTKTGEDILGHTDSEFGIWYWNGSTYVTVGQSSAATYAAPGSAFFVSAAQTFEDTSGNLDFRTGFRVKASDSALSDTNDWIGSIIDDNRAELFLSIYQSAFIEGTEIYFIENVTDGLDSGYDVRRFPNGNNAVSIFSRLINNDSGVDLGNQSLAYSEMWDKVIPLGINALGGEEMTIGISHRTTPADLNIYLEDTEEGTMTNLLEGDFVYTPTSDLEGVGRFFIHMTADTMSNEEVSTSMLNAYKEIDASYITIEGLATQANETNVSLYNILGRKVLSTTLNNNMGTQTISTVGLSAGIYVIELESGTDRLTKKLIIK